MNEDLASDLTSTRRAFLGTTGALLGGILLSGCGNSSSSSGGATTPSPPAPAGGADQTFPVGVLNLSTEMARFGLANMLPNRPDLDSTPIFVAGLQLAQQQRFQVITALPGTYWFQSLAGPRSHILLNGVSGLQVDLAGASLIFRVPHSSGFAIQDSDSVTLRNFSIDYDPLPFTQVTVESVNPQSGVVSVTSQAGFPFLSVFADDYPSNGTYAFAFDGNTGLRNWATPRFVAQVSGDTQVTLSNLLSFGDIHFGSLPGADATVFAQCLGTIAPGDTLVIQQRFGQPAIAVSDSSRITLRGITVHSSYVQGVFCQRVSDSQIDSCVIAPATGRLVSVNAGGIIFLQNGANNVISNNLAHSGCDDSYAMSSLAFGSITALGPLPTQFTLTTGLGGQTPSPGTVIDLYDPITCTFQISATVVNASPPGATVLVTVQDPLPSGALGALVTWQDATQLGKGGMIVNNRVISSHFARGIFINGQKDLLIQGNYIHENGWAGIYIRQWGDSDDWQCGPNANITIQNNVLENADSQMLGITDAQFGAILVHSINANGDVVQSIPNSNIVVQNNLLAVTTRCGLYYANVDSGTISDNIFQQTSLDPIAPAPGTFNTPALQQQFMNPLVVVSSHVNPPSATNENIPLLQVLPTGGQNAPGATATATQAVLPASPVTSISLRDSSGTAFNSVAIVNENWPISFRVPTSAASGAAVVTAVSGAQIARGGMFISPSS